MAYEGVRRLSWGRVEGRPAGQLSLSVSPSLLLHPCHKQNLSHHNMAQMHHLLGALTKRCCTQFLIISCSPEVANYYVNALPVVIDAGIEIVIPIALCWQNWESIVNCSACRWLHLWCQSSSRVCSCFLTEWQGPCLRSCTCYCYIWLSSTPSFIS